MTSREIGLGEYVILKMERKNEVQIHEPYDKHPHQYLNVVLLNS